jgi:hypothetical protein
MHGYWAFAFAVNSRAKHRHKQPTVCWNIDTYWCVPLPYDVPSIVKFAVQRTEETGEKPQTNNFNFDIKLGLGSHSDGFVGVLLPSWKQPANCRPDTAWLQPLHRHGMCLGSPCQRKPSLNTITIIFLYAPIVTLLTGVQNIQIDRLALIMSVIVFIGIPMILGIITKRAIKARKGEAWFQEVYRSAVGNVAMVALLATLVVLFSLNGQVLIQHPEEMIQVSIPLLLGFLIIVGFNLLVTRFAGLKYREGIIAVIIGSSSHFEIAIATAVSIYGLSSQAALGTTMGLFWEVPIMLGLVYLGKELGKRGFWKSN